MFWEVEENQSIRDLANKEVETNLFDINITSSIAQLTQHYDHYNQITRLPVMYCTQHFKYSILFTGPNIFTTNYYLNAYDSRICN